MFQDFQDDDIYEITPPYNESNMVQSHGSPHFLPGMVAQVQEERDEHTYVTKELVSFIDEKCPINHHKYNGKEPLLKTGIEDYEDTVPLREHPELAIHYFEEESEHHNFAYPDESLDKAGYEQNNENTYLQERTQYFSYKELLATDEFIPEQATNGNVLKDHIRTDERQSNNPDCPTNLQEDLNVHPKVSEQKSSADVSGRPLKMADIERNKARVCLPERLKQIVDSPSYELDPKYNVNINNLVSIDGEGDTYIICTRCSARFKSFWKLKLHSDQVHSKNDQFLCKHCPAKFKREKYLLPHLASHPGEKPFKCRICSHSFTTTHGFFQHMNKIHGKWYWCNQCPAKFGSSEVLKAHVKKHTSEKSFSCLVCPEIFKTRETARIHLMHVHPDEGPYTCVHCQTKFRKKGGMKRHITRFHSY